MPQRFSLRHIPAILEEHRDWILTTLSELQQNRSMVLPSLIDLSALGQNWHVKYIATPDRPKLYVRTQLQQLVISGDIENTEKCRSILLKWVRTQAESFLQDELKAVSHEIALPFTSVAIRNQKTVWGSCTSKGAISLNYKLIFLPYALARHVLIHELCHTKHHDHSTRFWQLVAKYDENWRQHKRQLREAEKLMPNWL